MLKERPRTIRTYLDGEKTKEDEKETSLRPGSIDEYIGQTANKEMLKIALASAKKRDVPLDHILLYGPPGLGKTTMAFILANEMASSVRYIAGPSVEKAGDIVSVLANMSDNDILFIDEIHRMDKSAEEILYSAMEDFFVSISIGKDDGQKKQIKMSLPKFTLIGATTRAGMLSAPLRDRFGILCRMEYYTDDELVQIIKRTASLCHIDVSDEGALMIAKCSRGTPRIANRTVMRVRDYCLAYEKETTDENIKAALETYGINEFGLDNTDMLILKTLKLQNGKALGLDTMSHIIGEDPETIESVYEPYLLKNGYILKTPRGRTITEKSLEILA